MPAGPPSQSPESLARALNLAGYVSEEEEEEEERFDLLSSQKDVIIDGAACSCSHARDDDHR